MDPSLLPLWGFIAKGPPSGFERERVRFSTGDVERGTDRIVPFLLVPIPLGWEEKKHALPSGRHLLPTLVVVAMVVAKKGVLLTCDATVKVFVLQLNEKRDPDKKFVLADLDETHLFVHKSAAEDIRKEVDHFLDKNTYQKPDHVEEY